MRALLVKRHLEGHSEDEPGRSASRPAAATRAEATPRIGFNRAPAASTLTIQMPERGADARGPLAECRFPAPADVRCRQGAGGAGADHDEDDDARGCTSTSR